MFTQIINAITKNGFSTVIFAAIGAMIALNYKAIVSWMWTTIQAGALVKSHEITIKELKAEIQTLRERMEDYNKLLLENSRIISRLEERLVQKNAKNRIKDKENEEI